MHEPAVRPERALRWLRRSRAWMSTSLRMLLVSLAILFLEIMSSQSFYVGAVVFVAALLWLTTSMALYLGILATRFLRYSLWHLLAIVFVASGSLALILQQADIWKLFGVFGLSGCGVALLRALHAADPDPHEE